jgi:prepilin-type N-terminal cleavage/methylation domain-containing protein
MKNRGFTLLEMMMVVAIFTMVMGTLLTLSLTFANTAEIQELRITNNDEARRLFLMLTPLVRQASRSTVNWGEMPGDRITFQMATDSDGNGFAINPTGAIELTGVMTIQRDSTDANNDGITMSQLVFIDDAGNVRVLANGLQEELAPAGAGEPIPDGVGFWAVRQGNGILITVRTEGRTRRGREFTTTVSEFILPRNNS